MLTKTTIDNAKRRRARYVIWDGKGGIPGFGLRVAPTGKRNFILSYRLQGSRRAITETIGTYGDLTLPQARKRAEDLRARVRTGGDPQAERKAREAAQARAAEALTVRGLVERYITALHTGMAATKRLQGRRAAPRYISNTVLHLRRFATAYGTSEADAIARSDVLRWLNPYLARPSTHRVMHGAVSRMYVWARRQDLVANNPTADIETSAAPARERVLSLEELAKMWRAAEQFAPLYRDLIHLTLVTGQRRAEVAGMTWDELDLQNALWTVPSGRTKARRQHTIPLPSLAVVLLQARRKALRGQPPAGALVLPTISQMGRANVPVQSWSWLKHKIDRGASIPPWRLHDFRRSLVTHCAEHGRMSQCWIP
jgi:integrase